MPRNVGQGPAGLGHPGRRARGTCLTGPLPL